MSRSNHFVLFLVGGFGVVLGGSKSAAQESWVGEKVIPTKHHTEVKFGDRVGNKQVYFPLRGTNIKVRDEREGWLRIFDGLSEGWVDKSDFILARDGPAYFHRRVETNPKDTYALFMRGLGWRQKGEFDIAIKDFDECIRLNPTEKAYFSNRGTAWFEKKDYDKAISDYSEAIRLDPKEALSFSNRGNAWNSKKDYDRGIKDCDEAIRLNPKFIFAFNNRGEAWRGKKEYDKAIRDFNEAIRLDPKYDSAFYNRACCYALQGRPDPAIDSLRHALEVGYRDFDYMVKDSDLDSIRNDPRYEELLKKYAK